MPLRPGVCRGPGPGPGGLILHVGLVSRYDSAAVGHREEVVVAAVEHAIIVERRGW